MLAGKRIAHSFGMDTSNVLADDVRDGFSRGFALKNDLRLPPELSELLLRGPDMTRWSDTWLCAAVEHLFHGA